MNDLTSNELIILKNAITKAEKIKAKGTITLYIILNYSKTKVLNNLII